MKTFFARARNTPLKADAYHNLSVHPQKGAFLSTRESLKSSDFLVSISTTLEFKSIKIDLLVHVGSCQCTKEKITKVKCKIINSCIPDEWKYEKVISGIQRHDNDNRKHLAYISAELMKQETTQQKWYKS